MAEEKKKYPTTIGEWCIEITQRSTPDLINYRAALQTMQTWEAFKAAFQWTRIFLLIEEIQSELDKRERTAKRG